MTHKVIMMNIAGKIRRYFIERGKYAIAILQIKNKLKYLLGIVKYLNSKEIAFPETNVKLYGLVFKSRKNSMDIGHLSYLFEPSTTRMIKNNKFDIFIDVGAHIGRYSLIAAPRSSYVLSFEPSKSNFNALSENINLNNLGRKIKPLNIGLLDRAGKETLFFVPSEEGLSSLLADKWESKKKTKETVIVDKLDNVVKREKIDVHRISAIKMDTEGTELSILKGATDLLSKGRATLIVEINETEMLEEMESFLSKFGYKKHDVLDGRNYIFRKGRF